MVDLGIFYYVRGALNRNENRSVIEENLSRQGLDAAAIAEAIAAVEANQEPGLPHPSPPPPPRHTLGILFGVAAFTGVFVLLGAVSLGVISAPMLERFALSSGSGASTTPGSITGTAAIPFVRTLLTAIAKDAELYRNTQIVPAFGNVRGCDAGVFGSTRVALLLSEIRTATGGSTSCWSDATSFVVQVSLPLTRTGAPVFLCVDSTGRPPSDSPAPLERGAKECF